MMMMMMKSAFYEGGGQWVTFNEYLTEGGIAHQPMLVSEN